MKDKSEISNRNLSEKKLKLWLKEKKVLFCFRDCENKKAHPNQNWYPALKKLVNEVLLFDPVKKILEYGPENLNNEFIKIVSKVKPDFIFLILYSHEIDIESVRLINKLFPKIKIIQFLGDEDIHFDFDSKYYALFFDYALIANPKYIADYNRLGFKNIISNIGVNLDNYRPLKIQKKYDLSLIGVPYDSRVETLRFLMKNKINIKLFGPGWYKYPEFKNIYGGPLETEEFIRVINQSKINLSLVLNTLGGPQIKGRVFEFAACKSFNLVEYFDEYKLYFREGKELIMFKDRVDLLKKIEYYLKHEKEREKIAKNSYERALKDYNIENDFLNLFFKIFQDESNFSRSELKINESVTLTEEDLRNFENVKNKVSKSKYVSFSCGKNKQNLLKNVLQCYGLKNSKKSISCCDYSLYSRNLGDFLSFQCNNSSQLIPPQDFCKLLNINQFMVKKDYFLEHFKEFKKIAEGNPPENFINSENTEFISIPLLTLYSIREVNYNFMIKSFNKLFLLKIYSLIHQKKIFHSSYIFYLILECLKRRQFFIMKNLFKSMFNQEYWFRIFHR